MPAGKYNITIEQGATFRKTITWRDALGNPIDLTSYTARMSIRSGYEAPLIHNMTTENGGITLGGALGTINLHLTALQTAAIEVPEGVYDLELVSATDVVRLLEGRVIVKPEVTT